MSCPKCGTRLRRVCSLSGSSAIWRQEASAANMISGVTCWKCGFWRDADIVPVVCGVPPRVDVSKRDYDPAEKTAVYHIVVKFFDSIAAQRGKGISWYTVAKLLTQSGHRCQEKTLQKYFLLEQGKRCGDEKAP